MGNYCKSLGDENVDFLNLRERIRYKTTDTKWRNLLQLWHNAGTPSTTVDNLKTAVGKEKIISDTSLMTIQEFVTMCAKNRPPGVSNEDWDWFTSSSCREFFKLEVEDEFDKKPLTKAESFTLLGTCSQSQTSFDALKGASLEECVKSSSETRSVSSVEFAERIVLPDESGYDPPSNTKSTWSSLPDWSFACLDQFSSDVEFGAESNSKLNSECKKLYLKDMPIIPIEDNPFNEENKSPLTPISSTNDSVLRITDHIDARKTLYDETTPKLQIIEVT